MRELIRTRVEGVKDNMAFGGGVPSFEAYRELVGQVRGLHEAIEMLDEAERLVEERERGH
jgi:hypothetical protein